MEPYGGTEQGQAGSRRQHWPEEGASLRPWRVPDSKELRGPEREGEGGHQA